MDGGTEAARYRIGAVFLAELGDKTQPVTMRFVSREGASLVAVFVAASLALITTSAIGVAAGATVSTLIPPELLSHVAGAGFILVGVWTIWRA
ncbi:MAG: TMEM165/GDT1 family protein [Burkholderiales bacterium]|nr:TMEM165/GDT1 family protein [Burkholderiales bacterium]